MQPLADEERRLVASAQRGDLESFNQLVRLYEGRVYNLCLRMLGDPESAADATQDSFISAYRNLRSFRGGSFRSWLLRIATNACYDVLRVRKRKPATSLDAALSSDDENMKIATITNSNLGTVKSRLSRGRARLRDILRAGELLPNRYRHEDKER